MGIVRFPGWRKYDGARREANDAMMALLLASRIGSHVMSTSAAAPDLQLSQLYAKIAGIERLNVTAARAADLMGRAEQHLAFMAIPFAIAVQDSLMQHVVELLRLGRKDYDSTHWTWKYKKKPGDIGVGSVHQYIEERLGQPLDAANIALFRLANRIRNRIIHHRGVPNDALLDDYAKGWGGHRAAWQALTNRPLGTDAEGLLEIGEPELVATLAVCKRLAVEVNAALQPPFLDSRFWAEILIEDYRSANPQRFGQRHERARKLASHARQFYSPLAFTAAELEVVASEIHP